LGLVKSEKKAMKLWKRAVELGDVDAMGCLALGYMKGEGVRLDRKKAMQLFRMGADRGDANSMLNVAFILDEDGWTGPPGTWRPATACSIEASHWYELAAQTGLHDAEYNIAICYLHGVVGDDIDKAWLMLERLAANGYEKAIEALKILSP
jgi:hypothetical protein